MSRGPAAAAAAAAAGRYMPHSEAFVCGERGGEEGREANPTSALPSFSFFDPKIGPKQRTTILLHIGGKGERRANGN